MTTFTTFVTGLQDMTVVGVRRVFAAPPSSIPSSDIPAMWVQLPEGEDRPITTEGGGGWPSLSVEIWIAVKALQQGTSIENYDATVEIIDNLIAALQALPTGRATGAVSQSKLTWTIRGDYSPRGQTDYWVVIARVTGNG